VREIPRCPVCGEQAGEVLEEVALTRVNERGVIVPIRSMVTNHWWECPTGHGRLEVIWNEPPPPPTELVETRRPDLNHPGKDIVTLLWQEPE
jgi:hypothetical protein